jgi:hypothetical protein
LRNKKFTKFWFKSQQEEIIQKTRHIWEDNIKAHFREVGLEGGDKIHVALDKDWQWTLLDTVMNLWVP